MKKILRNQKGSVLQIVLILFFVLSTSILSTATLVLENARAFQRSKQLHVQRTLEVAILGYYKYEIKEGLLLSDEIKIDDYIIYYTVDDMSDYYEITTTIENKETIYSFITSINIQNLLVTKFEYQ